MAEEQLTADEALLRAVDSHRGRRLGEADQLYRAILQALPDHPEANHNLGVLCCETGRAAMGLSFMAKAIEVAPNQAVFYWSYANRLLGAGRASDALSVMEQAAVHVGLTAEGQEVLTRVHAALANPEPFLGQDDTAATASEGFYATNRSFWSDATIAQEYAVLEGVYPVEASLFEKMGPSIMGKRILEIGVGAGRLTPSLTKLSRQYLGVDYSEAMVRNCAVKFPEYKFQICDARDMSRFADASVDFLIFSFNGIDSLLHEERLSVWRQFRRVVAPDGVMVFSSHNRNYLKTVDRQPRNAEEEANKAKAAQFEHTCEEYAIVNDGTHGFRIAQYYITIEQQIAQLRRCGYKDVKPIDLSGKWLVEDEYAACTSCWVYYVCYPD